MSSRTRGSDHTQRTAPDPQPVPTRSKLHELPVLVLLSLVLAIATKSFLIQAFWIPSGSMLPTLRIGDRVLVNRLAYRFGDIERFDVVVFRDPNPEPAQDRGVIGGFLLWLGEGTGLARPADEDFIKRVIGLPGEVVEIREGVTYVDGSALDEPYLQGPEDLRDYGPAKVPDGMLFVMGDNRLHSGDSRFEPPIGLGYVPLDNVVGQAFVIAWPPGEWGTVR